jgi:ribosomal protein L27
MKEILPSIIRTSKDDSLMAKVEGAKIFQSKRSSRKVVCEVNGKRDTYRL